MWDRQQLEAVTNCPACGSTLRDVVYDDLGDYSKSTEGTWSLWRCRACGSGYLDPRPTLDSIGLAYSGYYTHSHKIDSLGLGARIRRRLAYGYLNDRYGYALEPAWTIGASLLRLSPPDRSRAERVVRHLPKFDGHPRLLDLGSGNGAFLAMMQWQGWEVLGIDFDEKAVIGARDRDVAVVAGSDDTMDTLTPGSFDAVTIHHVLEHSHDPKAMLRRAHAVLRDDGLLWLATPNMDSRAHKRFGQNWRGLDSPRHLTIFTRSALQQLVINAGFDIIEVPPPGWDEAWYFGQSRKIEDRAGSAKTRTLLPLPVAARLADWMNWRRPSKAEELAIVARRHPA